MRGRRPATALDLLEREDQRVRTLLRQLNEARGPSVEDRAAYGDLAKRLIRHVAEREAAAVQVAQGLAETAGLEAVASRLQADRHRRRQLIDRVDHLARGVQGVNVNARGDFSVALDELAEALLPVVEWELEEAVPSIRRLLGPDAQAHAFRGARKTARRAPTSLDPAGPRWYEQAPVISRLLTIYDHMRDLPAARGRDRAPFGDR